MRFDDLLSMSVNNLKRRGLRTLLTVLGVVIGTGSIVVMISLGLGLQKQSRKLVEWGILGCVFRFLLPEMERVLGKMQGGGWRIASAGLSVLLAVDIIVTSMCLIRWSNRHAGVPAGNGLERLIDRIYSDEVMEKRFCEWYFILMGSEPGRHADKEKLSPSELGHLAAAQRIEASQGVDILMDDRNN